MLPFLYIIAIKNSQIRSDLKMRLEITCFQPLEIGHVKLLSLSIEIILILDSNISHFNKDGETQA
jgi:hypothetical protein